MDRKDVAASLLTYFTGRTDHYAEVKGDFFQPVEGTLSIEDMEQHLAQERELGFYIMRQDEKVLCTAADLDDHGKDDKWWDKTVQVEFALSHDLGIGSVIEISQSGSGAHVWVFFEEAVPAWKARKLWQTVESFMGWKFGEVYPRQDYLSGKGMGNLIRYPFRNKSRFVNRFGETVRFGDLLIPTTSESQLDELLGQEVKAPEPQSAVEDVTDLPMEIPPRVAGIISRGTHLFASRWHGGTAGLEDDSKSSLIQSMCTMLVQMYVPTNEALQALRYWCTVNGYEKGLKPGWLEGSLSKAYNFVAAMDEAVLEESRCMTALDACAGYINILEQGGIKRIPSGVNQLDASIEGIARGEVAVIAARPSHGKTCLALQWLKNCKDPTLFVSLEMSSNELGRRLVQTEVGSTQDLSKVVDAVESFRDGRLHIAFGCDRLDRMVTLIENFVDNHQVAMVAIDYLQLASVSDSKGLREDMTSISRELKKLAQRRDIAILLLCQSNRAVEGREGYVPSNTDLRESGGIESDADIVLHVQWMIRFSNIYDRYLYRIHVTKHRNGAIRVPLVETAFNADFQTIGTLRFQDQQTELPPPQGEVNGYLPFQDHG